MFLNPTAIRIFETGLFGVGAMLLGSGAARKVSEKALARWFAGGEAAGVTRLAGVSWAESPAAWESWLSGIPGLQKAPATDDQPGPALAWTSKSSGSAYALLPIAPEALPESETLFPLRRYGVQRSVGRAGPAGQNLIYGPVMSSTQDLLSELYARLPDGTIVLADVQSAGRGRSSNKWESPKGALMWSLKRSLARGGSVVPRLPFFQYFVTTVLAQAVYHLAPGGRTVDGGILRLKWPNDLYSTAGAAKIGGTLCQSFAGPGSGEFTLLTGIGLNVDNSQPTTCINDLLAAVSLPRVDRGDLLAAFCSFFEGAYPTFVDVGFDGLLPEYYNLWLHSDQKIHIGGAAISQELEIKGLAPSGYLLAVDAVSLQRFELSPDGNSFDWFHGLLSKKI